MVDTSDQIMPGIVVAASVAIAVAAAELLHAARVRRVAGLAFGPSRRPMLWARLAPWLRVLAASSAAWGLVTLYFLPPKAHRAGQVKPGEIRRLILVLDVSPSNIELPE